MLSIALISRFDCSDESSSPSPLIDRQRMFAILTDHKCWIKPNVFIASGKGLVSLAPNVVMFANAVVFRVVDQRSVPSMARGSNQSAS